MFKRSLHVYAVDQAFSDSVHVCDLGWTDLSLLLEQRLRPEFTRRRAQHHPGCALDELDKALRPWGRCSGDSSPLNRPETHGHDLWLHPSGSEVSWTCKELSFMDLQILYNFYQCT